MITKAQAEETIEDAIRELRGYQNVSDSSITIKELDELIDKMYSLQLFVEVSEVPLDFKEVFEPL